MTFPQLALHSRSDPRAGLRAEIREEEEIRFPIAGEFLLRTDHVCDPR